MAYLAMIMGQEATLASPFKSALATRLDLAASNRTPRRVATIWVTLVS
jgi:hypothetical protein